MVWTILSFSQNFRKRQYGLNRIVFLSKFSKKTIWIEPYCLLVKTFEKDNMVSTILSFGQNCKKKNNMGWTISSFGENFLKSQYGLNRIVFCQKFTKRHYGLNHIVFWSKLWKKTRYIEPCCLLVKVFLKDTIVWTVLSFCQNILKRQYGFNHIVF